MKDCLLTGIECCQVKQKELFGIMQEPYHLMPFQNYLRRSLILDQSFTL